MTMRSNLPHEFPNTAGASPSCAPDDPIHLESLLIRCLSDREFCGALMQKFAVRAAELSTALARAADSCNSLELTRQAHAVEGLAANWSAADLRFWAAALERAARTGNPERAWPMVGKVRAEIDRCLAAVPRVLEQLAQHS